MKYAIKNGRLKRVKYNERRRIENRVGAFSLIDEIADRLKDNSELKSASIAIDSLALFAKMYITNSVIKIES